MGYPVPSMYRVFYLNTAINGWMCEGCEASGSGQRHTGKKPRDRMTSLLPYMVISSHGQLVSSLFGGLKKIRPGILNFFLDPPLTRIVQVVHL